MIKTNTDEQSINATQLMNACRFHKLPVENIEIGASSENNEYYIKAKFFPILDDALVITKENVSKDFSPSDVEPYIDWLKKEFIEKGMSSLNAQT